MIINEKQVLKGMKDETLKVTLPVNIKKPLMEAHELFSKMNQVIDSDNALLTLVTETEGRMNRLLLESLHSQPLVDLNELGYKNVIEDSIRYLFVPKDKKVDNYVVDIITILFRHKGDNSEVSVNIPFYLISDNQTESVVLMETDEDNVKSVESLLFFQKD